MLTIIRFSQTRLFVIPTFATYLDVKDTLTISKTAKKERMNIRTKITETYSSLQMRLNLIPNGLSMSTL